MYTNATCLTMDVILLFILFNVRKDNAHSGTKLRHCVYFPQTICLWHNQLINGVKCVIETRMIERNSYQYIVLRLHTQALTLTPTFVPSIQRKGRTVRLQINPVRIQFRYSMVNRTCGRKYLCSPSHLHNLPFRVQVRPVKMENYW